MTISYRPDGSAVVARDDGGETWVPDWAVRALQAPAPEPASKSKLHASHVFACRDCGVGVSEPAARKACQPAVEP